jgi:hypothetical protein
MKYSYLILPILVIACSCGQKKGHKTIFSGSFHAANLLKSDAVNKRVVYTHRRIVGINGNFTSFKKYLSGLNDRDVESIPFALDYIKTCLPSNLKERDSVMLLFNLKFFKITNGLSDSLETRYAAVLKQMEDHPKASKPTNFVNNLNTCGIGVFQTEGNYYLDVLPDYFYNNFNNRVSPGVKQYLFIRKTELAQGFTEDAGLLISYKALYDRVKQWERFLIDFPNTVYDAEANNYYTTYLETLLSGTDNSRIFDDTKNILLPEVKTIYEKAMGDNTTPKTAKIIADYYNFLGRHGFKENDSIPAFLSEHKLSTMLAVQPDTR